MLVIGHRGSPRLAVENTLESLRIATDGGADGVEFDVQLCADGEPVLFHDDSLRRLAAVPLRLARLDWRELRDYSLRSGQLQPQRPTHLDQVLDWWVQKPVWLNVELKVAASANSAAVALLASTVAKRLRQFGSQSGLLDRVVVSSFSRPALAHFAEQLPQVRRAALIDERPVTDWWHLNQPQATAEIGQVHPPFRQLSADKLVDFKAVGWPVWPWTVNGPRNWERVCQWALADLVQGTITDDPALLVSFVIRHLRPLQAQRKAPQ